MAHILAADIGGTNSRFALFEYSGGRLEMVDSIWLKTHGASSFQELLSQLWASDFSAQPGAFQSGALAVAGAVQHGMVCENLPNAPWGVDLNEVSFGSVPVRLINDFVAQAYACRTLAVEDSLIIQHGIAEEIGVVGVIGAGTGLGYSALLHTHGTWIALPSEGGHMAFPFYGRAELEYAEFNCQRSGRNWAEGDSVVTGLGLSLIHEFLTGETLAPEDVSQSITQESETAKWFARFYGRACRNWALALMAHGGLFIAGGMAAKNTMLVNHPCFIEEFHNTHVYSNFLRSVPIKLNTNEESGLFGAAFYAQQLLGSE